MQTARDWSQRTVLGIATRTKLTSGTENAPLKTSPAASSPLLACRIQARLSTVLNTDRFESSWPSAALTRRQRAGGGGGPQEHAISLPASLRMPYLCSFLFLADPLLHKDATHLNIRYALCAVCRRQANFLDVRSWASGKVKRYCKDHMTEASLSLKEITKFSAHQDSLAEFQKNCSQVEERADDIKRAIAVQVLRIKQLARTVGGDKNGAKSSRQAGKRRRRH
eukprot:758969-Hanusia_phi.AAC.2